MKYKIDIKEAIALQKKLAIEVKREWLLKEINNVAGIDVTFTDQLAIACACLYELPRLVKVQAAFCVGEIDFPYVPGLLSFREMSVMKEAIGKLPVRPDLLIVDGQGIAHPRRFGIASHLGVELSMPSIGCAKSILVGKHRELQATKGSKEELLEGEEILGVALRTKSNVKPVFVSIGHMITLEESIKIVLGCCSKYRLPEPVRCAHNMCSDIRKQYLSDTLNG